MSAVYSVESSSTALVHQDTSALFAGSGSGSFSVQSSNNARNTSNLTISITAIEDDGDIEGRNSGSSNGTPHTARSTCSIFMPPLYNPYTRVYPSSGSADSLTTTTSMMMMPRTPQTARSTASIFDPWGSNTSSISGSSGIAGEEAAVIKIRMPGAPTTTAVEKKAKPSPELTIKIPTPSIIGRHSALRSAPLPRVRNGKKKNSWLYSPRTASMPFYLPCIQEEEHHQQETWDAYANAVDDTFTTITAANGLRSAPLLPLTGKNLDIFTSTIDNTTGTSPFLPLPPPPAPHSPPSMFPHLLPHTAFTSETYKNRFPFIPGALTHFDNDTLCAIFNNNNHDDDTVYTSSPVPSLTHSPTTPSSRSSASSSSSSSSSPTTPTTTTTMTKKKPVPRPLPLRRLHHNPKSSLSYPTTASLLEEDPSYLLAREAEQARRRADIITARAVVWCSAQCSSDAGHYQQENWDMELNDMLAATKSQNQSESVSQKKQRRREVGERMMGLVMRRLSVR
ncbi:hypothetical protein AJ80_04301 [Polytolypa hystricis UAMH7299]|uniref:Uncharacterized protein n=1 Tax=Polytolypa hystricis (strain UAMH7299) TaxID=1447883 RepID=A0A2B7YCW9_POLH7|nr:hypothetical protein AJ80_04301 [Polytolypa hystricis UAMH7299]